MVIGQSKLDRGKLATQPATMVRKNKTHHHLTQLEHLTKLGFHIGIWMWWFQLMVRTTEQLGSLAKGKGGVDRKERGTLVVADARFVVVGVENISFGGKEGG